MLSQVCPHHERNKAMRMLILTLAALLASATAAPVPEYSTAWRAAYIEPTPNVTPPHIVGKAQYQLGEKIALSFDGATPPDAVISFSWRCDGTEFERQGTAGDVLYVWTTKPGVYTAELIVTYQITMLKPGPNFKNDKTDLVETTLTLPLPTLKHVLAVGTPEPEPEPSPQPGPTPGPRPGSLGALISSATVRATLVELFTDLAQAVRDGAFTSTGHFRAGYRKTIADAKASGELPAEGLTPIDKPISDRITAAIGLSDTVLDDVKKTKLAETLASVSGEFVDVVPNK